MSDRKAVRKPLEFLDGDHESEINSRTSPSFPKLLPDPSQSQSLSWTKKLKHHHTSVDTVTKPLARMPFSALPYDVVFLVLKEAGEQSWEDLINLAKVNSDVYTVYDFHKFSLLRKTLEAEVGDNLRSVMKHARRDSGIHHRLESNNITHWDRLALLQHALWIHRQHVDFAKAAQRMLKARMTYITMQLCGFIDQTGSPKAIAHLPYWISAAYYYSRRGFKKLAKMDDLCAYRSTDPEMHIRVAFYSMVTSEMREICRWDDGEPPNQELQEICDRFMGRMLGRHQWRKTMEVGGFLDPGWKPGSSRRKRCNKRKETGRLIIRRQELEEKGLWHEEGNCSASGSEARGCSGKHLPVGDAHSKAEN